MNFNQALAIVALLMFYMIYSTAAARYVPKWKKQACEVPASQNEQSHYTCDDNGDVKCLPGKKEPFSLIYLRSLIWCSFTFAMILILKDDY